MLGVASDVIETFKAYTFPGNVRELENEIRRMVAVAKDGEYLTRRHPPPELAKLRAVEPPAAKLGLKAEGKSLKEMVESLERQLVLHALEKQRWNQSRTAKEIGSSRVGLANKIRRYEFDEKTRRFD